MISKLLYAFSAGARRVTEHPRVLFVVVLAVVFPLSLWFLAQQFLSIGTDNFETMQRARVGTLHNVAHVLIESEQNSTQHLTDHLSKLAQENHDLTKFKIAQLQEDSIVLVAGLEGKGIGAPVDDEEAYRRALLTSGSPVSFEFSINETRFWQTFSTYTDTNGTVWFIFSELSFESLDNIIESRQWVAYSLLTLAYLFLLLLAYWQIKNIDYRAKFKTATEQLKERDQFANVIAHELRSPLTAMRGYASLIEEAADEEKIKMHASRIRESTERQVQLVNDFLEVARLQSGDFKVEVESVDLHSLLTTVCDELRPLATEKDLKLTLQEPNKVLSVMADRARLQQVMTNVISNSIKYTKDGAVTITISDKVEKVEVRVKDTGVGISAEHQKKLFAPFYRVQNKDTQKITGTGLGMWITKRLVEHMGGFIGVESIQDVGTNVVILLPKVKES